MRISRYLASFSGSSCIVNTPSAFICYGRKDWSIQAFYIKIFTPKPDPNDLEVNILVLSFDNEDLSKTN